MNARDLIIDLLLGLQGREISIKQIIIAAKLFEISENSIRVAVTRLSSDGVIEAIELGASRIGHGVQITQGAGALERMARAREADVHFENCPTSNVHTGAWQDLATHPMIAMEKAGLNGSVQADNRLISVLTQGSEFQVAHEICGLSLAQIMQGQIRASRASFLPEAARHAAEQRIRAWCIEQAIAIK